jgi:hypothetical protein
LSSDFGKKMQKKCFFAFCGQGRKTPLSLSYLDITLAAVDNACIQSTSAAVVLAVAILALSPEM